jgi:hypothetical protein
MIPRVLWFVKVFEVPDQGCSNVVLETSQPKAARKFFWMFGETPNIQKNLRAGSKCY